MGNTKENSKDNSLQALKFKKRHSEYSKFKLARILTKYQVPNKHQECNSQRCFYNYVRNVIAWLT